MFLLEVAIYRGDLGLAILFATESAQLSVNGAKGTQLFRPVIQE